MDCPFVSGIIPTFKIGRKHIFIVFGCGFIDGPQLKVQLKNEPGHYAWQVEADKTKFLSSTRIEVHAKPVKGTVRDPGGGVGDLTTTVTNGDGTATPPSSALIYYDDSPDHVT
jgi:hypothetical protein